MKLYNPNSVTVKEGMNKCARGVRHALIFTISFRDEDMQSLASLMSMKQADIGNLDDFEEENEEDEENRVNQEEKAAKITGEEDGDEESALTVAP